MLKSGMHLDLKQDNGFLLRLNPILTPQGRLSFEVGFAANQQYFHNNFVRISRQKLPKLAKHQIFKEGYKCPLC